MHIHCVSITAQDRLIKPILIHYHICPMLHRKLVTNMVFIWTASLQRHVSSLIIHNFIPSLIYSIDKKPAAYLGIIGNLFFLFLRRIFLFETISTNYFSCFRVTNTLFAVNMLTTLPANNLIITHFLKIIYCLFCISI